MINYGERYEPTVKPKDKVMAVNKSNPLFINRIRATLSFADYEVWRAFEVTPRLTSGHENHGFVLIIEKDERGFLKFQTPEISNNKVFLVLE